MDELREYYFKENAENYLAPGALLHRGPFDRVYNIAQGYLNDIAGFSTLPPQIYADGLEMLGLIKDAHDMFKDLSNRIAPGEREKGLNKAYEDICSLTDELEVIYHRGRSANRFNQITDGL